MKEDAEEQKIAQAPRPAKAKKQRTFSPFAEMLVPYFPDLKKKLYRASMAETPAQFLERVIGSSILLSATAALLLGLVFSVVSVNVLFALLAFVILLPLSFLYLMFYPEARIVRRQQDIDSELVFAGRHILIALRAGMPLFDALVGVSSGYGAVSEEFRRIVEKINLGIPMGQALREAGTNTTSGAFARIVMQIANAISSGADVSSSLEIVLNQIAREQAIALKAYGQKLNPIIMFYMIMGIIFPSLGVAFAIILFSLVSSGTIGLTPVSLIYVLVVISLVQYLFLSLVESSRPKYVL
ncbi:MAG: type II secretion system F family protein [Candidatus ainarchaeum sp.]|nr:type II secretion system F family protein [Candidatus ainarchaeum sp.]